MKYYVISNYGYDGLGINSYPDREQAQKSFEENKWAIGILEGREVKVTFGRTRHGTKSLKRQRIHWDEDDDTWRDEEVKDNG